MESSPTTPGGWPTDVKIITIAEVVSKEKDIWSPHHGPQLGSPVPGRWTPNMLGFEASGTYFWKSQRTLGNRDSLLKGTHQISQVQGHRTEAVIWKETGSDLLADIRRLPGGTRSNWDPPGDINVVAAILGCLFYQDTDTASTVFKKWLLFIYMLN